MAQSESKPETSTRPALSGITVLLRQAAAGDRAAEAALTEALFGVLHRMASRHMAKEAKGHTLQATALVNEVWLRLASAGIKCEDRGHYLAAAARAMRWVLIDHARKGSRVKRGSGVQRVLLDDVVDLFEARSGSLLDLDDALERMKLFNPQMVDAIELRFFGGVDAEECARLLAMSRRTFERRWAVAAAWLRAELKDED